MNSINRVARTNTDTAERTEEVERNRQEDEKKVKKVETSDANTAKKRLMQDLKSLRASTSGDAGDTLGIYAAPKDDDIFVWKAVVYGPENTVWEGGFFKLELHFSAEYPVVPPRVKFLTKVFHPNVYVDGNICLDTLKSNWSPTLNVEMLLLSIRSLLCDPNPLSAANGEAAQTLTTNPQAYEQKVKELVAASLEQSISDDDA